MTNTAVSVLDHGLIRLVDSMGGDLSIVRNARNSHNAAWRTGEDSGSDARLINYLYQNRHTTPFEAVTVQFEIKAPIFVFRQWHRHRTQSYNEVSARYTELPEVFYVPEPELIGVQVDSDKQKRQILDEPRSLTPDERKLQITKWMKKQNQTAFMLYRDLLEEGVPRELARTVLPLATYSHMFATANLHNWFHFLGLRMGDHAQYEIAVYAEAMLKMLCTIAPIACAAFWEHSLGRRPDALKQYLEEESS